MNNVRLRRLQSDLEAMRLLVRLQPKIKVESVSGDPPERYKLLLQVRSLRERGSKLEYIQEHQVEIRLPLGYPRDAPVCRMLTPVFHPNIAPHSICIGDHWSAGESLDALVMRICEMLAYQSYNVKSPLNGEAAKWAAENLSLLPLDPDAFFVETEIDNELVVQGSVCSNCREAVDDTVARCHEGHLLCTDCVLYCDHCNKILCLVCGILECTECTTIETT